MAKANLRILVVDDEAAMREVLEARLSGFGYAVATAASGVEASAQLNAAAFDVVISDLVLPDLSGLELITRVRTLQPDARMLMMTAYGTIATAVQAMKLGAVEFLTKPLDYVALRRLLLEVSRQLPSAAEQPPQRSHASASRGQAEICAGLLGSSQAHRDLCAAIDAMGPTSAPVFIVGESGVGKELVARALHAQSPRAETPFVAVNAAAIPDGMTESLLLGHVRGAFTGAVDNRKGLFEQASGGTLFLDEIAEMQPGLQAKLLRVLEDGRVRPMGAATEVQTDVRLVAATNREPEAAIREGFLREDLYHRLNVLRIDVAPLRERLEDIDPLAQHFLAYFNARYDTDISGISEEARLRLHRYRWPGNVRELRNAMERACILTKGGVLDAHLLPHTTLPAPSAAGGIVIPPGVTLADAERILILETLREVQDNKAEAARRLGLDVKTIRNRLKAFGDVRGTEADGAG